VINIYSEVIVDALLHVNKQCILMSAKWKVFVELGSIVEATELKK